MVDLNKRSIKLSPAMIAFSIIIFMIAGKIIRYTVMKPVLVDAGIGHGWIKSIISANSVELSLFGDLNINNNAVLFYKIINIFGIKTYEGFELYISCLYSVILFFIILKVRKNLELSKYLFFAMSVIVLSIFDLTLSKDPIQMLYFITAFLIIICNKIPDKRKNIFVAFILVLISVTFRMYYLLALLFFISSQIMFRFLYKIKNFSTTTKIAIFLFSSVLIYFVFLNFLSIINPEIYLELIRVRTRTNGARSDILSIVPNYNIATFCINYLLVILRVLLPIELLPLGIKYYPYVIYQLIVTAIVFKKMKRMSHNSAEQNIALYLYIGFLFCSASFEPDFGSWIRHEGVMFPIFLILNGSVDKRHLNGGTEHEDSTYKLFGKK